MLSKNTRMKSCHSQRLRPIFIENLLSSAVHRNTCSHQVTQISDLLFSVCVQTNTQTDTQTPLKTISDIADTQVIIIIIIIIIVKPLV